MTKKLGMLLTNIAFITTSLFVLSGCASKSAEKIGYVPELDSVISARDKDIHFTSIAKVTSIGEASLLASSELHSHSTTIAKNIIVTSIVDVNDFGQSSDFGRLFSESMITNFTRLGWNVIDYRGKNVVVRKRQGEFYLSRLDMKEFPSDSVVFVGTYGEYQDGLLLNMRILDKTTNKIITVSNIQLNDDNSLAMSKKSNCLSLECKNRVQNSKKSAQVESGFSIGLKKDDCKNTARCECENPETCLGEGINND